MSIRCTHLNLSIHGESLLRSVSSSMFGWSTQYCPCDPAAKAWIERRFGWISRKFRSTIFTDHPLILPNSEFFPEPYDPSEESARALLVRVCHFMGVPEARVKLRFHHEPHKLWLVNKKGDYLPLAAGIYERSGRKDVIILDTVQISEPANLVTTIAHELAHARLIGEGKVRANHYDDELLTDLTAFCLGFAIFMANSPRAWVSQFTKWPGTQYNKPEYMTAPMYGYALAHLAWIQGQPKPDWIKYLGPHVINDFKDASRFLFKTGDSSFRPDPTAHTYEISFTISE